MKPIKLTLAIIIPLMLMLTACSLVQADDGTGVQLEVEVVASPLNLEVHLKAPSDIEVTDWDGDGRWRNDTWYLDLYPGEEASMELRIESSEDAVIYVEYNSPAGLFLYFDPSAFEIEEDDTEWMEITIYAFSNIKPDDYKINFYFEAIPIGTKIETETVYRNKYLPGTEKIRYVDRLQHVDRAEYIDREVIKYIYSDSEGNIGWWWVPIGSILSALLTLGITLIVRRGKEE